MSVKPTDLREDSLRRAPIYAWGGDDERVNPPPVVTKRKGTVYVQSSPKEADYIGTVHRCSELTEPFFLELNVEGYRCSSLATNKSVVVFLGPLGVRHECPFIGTYRVYKTLVGENAQICFALKRENEKTPACCK